MVRLLLFVLVSFASVQCLVAQQPRTADSLWRVVAGNAHDTTKVLAFNSLSEWYFRVRSDYDSALVCVSQAKVLAEKTGFRRGQMLALRNFAAIFTYQSKYNDALKSSFALLAIAQELQNPQGIASAYNGIAIIYNFQAKYPEALEYYFKSLKMQETLSNKQGTAAALSNIGIVYDNQRQYAAALEYYFKAAKIHEELGNKINTARTFGNIGIVYLNQRQFSKALEYYTKALRLQEEVGNKQDISRTLGNIGNVYDEQGKYAEALDNHTKSLVLKERLGNQDGVAGALINIGSVATKQRDYVKAESSLKRGYALADSIGALANKQRALRLMTVLYDSLGRYKEALAALEKAWVLQDSLMTAENLKKTAELKEQYESEKKDAAIALLQKDKDVQALTLAKQQTELAKRQAELAREHAESERRQQSLLLIENERQLQSLALEQQEAQLTEARLLSERDKQALALAEKDKSLKDSELGRQTAELRRQRVIQWSLAGILLLAVVAAIWLGNLYRQKRTANREILRQQNVLQEQATEIELVNSQLHESNLGLDSALKDLKDAQTQLVQSERMSAVGTLTAGVMHEINNPNAIIYSAIQQTRTKLVEMSTYFLSLLDEESKDSAEVRKYQAMSNDALARLDLAADGSSRVKTIVANLQDFTKHQENGVSRGDWAKEIRGTVALFTVQYERVGVTLNIPSEMSIQANFGELNQVLLNLLVNAAQAGASEIEVVGELSETQAIMRVADNGTGMSEETAAQIFEPFFTTKGVGNSGLGLSIVKKMVEAMNGRVWCESELGKGARFIVELPIA